MATHLASKLKNYENKSDVVVLGLSRGGISVAFEIAQRLHVPLDVIVVRKLGVPWKPELAMGAVASGGVSIVDDGLIRSLGLSNYYVYNLIAKMEEEVQIREALYRDGYSPQPLCGRIAILVDDGAATGATMLAAVEAIRKQRPKEIVVAVPVASHDACKSFEAAVGKCVCLGIPETFFSVDEWYQSFPQETDSRVQTLLAQSRARQEADSKALAHSAAG